MPSQRLERHVPRFLQGDSYTCFHILQGLRGKLHQHLSGISARTRHRLLWFGGLYLASLVSFSGLISAVRWTLELL